MVIKLQLKMKLTRADEKKEQMSKTGFGRTVKNIIFSPQFS